MNFYSNLPSICYASVNTKSYGLRHSFFLPTPSNSTLPPLLDLFTLGITNLFSTNVGFTKVFICCTWKLWGDSKTYSCDVWFKFYVTFDSIIQGSMTSNFFNKNWSLIISQYNMSLTIAYLWSYFVDRPLNKLYDHSSRYHCEHRSTYLSFSTNKLSQILH